MTPPAGSGPGKAVGEDAAVEAAAEIPLHLLRHRPIVIVAFAAVDEPGLELFLNAAIEHALARAARPVPRGAPARALALHAPSETIPTKDQLSVGHNDGCALENDFLSGALGRLGMPSAKR